MRTRRGGAREVGAGEVGAREVEVRVEADGHVLAGSLTLPPSGPVRAAALLLPGSGPVDRDSDTRRMPLGITRELAHALAAAGVASLRYDKRGTGRSAGSWREAGFYDGVDDAAAALAELRSRPEVEGAVPILVGHSEGAWVAAALAGRTEGLAGVALLSGSATAGEQVLLWQAARIAPTLPRPVRLLLRLLRTDLVRKVAQNHAEVRATTTDVARIGGVRLNARWTREFLDHDPKRDLARLRVPVLAVTGAKDLQADPADVDEIARTVPGPVEAHVVPDVSHLLRFQPGPPSLRAYKREVRQPLDPRVVRLVVDWATRRSAVGR